MYGFVPFDCNSYVLEKNLLERLSFVLIGMSPHSGFLCQSSWGMMATSLWVQNWTFPINSFLTKGFQSKDIFKVIKLVRSQLLRLCWSPKAIIYLVTNVEEPWISLEHILMLQPNLKGKSYALDDRGWLLCQSRSQNKNRQLRRLRKQPQRCYNSVDRVLSLSRIVIQGRKQIDKTK